MKLSNFLFIGLAAATVVQRDLATFQAAFAAVGDSLSALQSSASGLTPTSDIPSAVNDLTAKSNAVASALDTGSANINASSTLNLLDAVNLLNLSDTLINTASGTIDTLISKKDIIAGAGQTGLVISQLQAVKASTYGFIGAISSKVPSAVSGIAQQRAGQVIDVINRGITGFGGSAAK